VTALTLAEVDAHISVVRDWLDQYPEATVLALYEARAWEVKGYADWDALCAAEFPRSIRLPRPERRGIVTRLRGAGMSTRAIASAVGVADGTVRNDLTGAQDCTPVSVTGLDGKRYPPRREDDVPRREAAVQSWIAADPSGDIRRANLRAEFSRWMATATRLHTFDALEMAAISPDRADEIAAMRRMVDKWDETYRTAVARPLAAIKEMRA